MKAENLLCGSCIQPKKKFKVQIIGILQEIDSFYWRKMHLWKGDKTFGQNSPPPSFGQSPKEQLHFFVKPSLTLKRLCIEVFVHQIQPSDISPQNFWSHLPFENGLFSLREAISWEIEDGRTIIFVKYLNFSLSGWSRILPDPSFEKSKSKISQTQICVCGTGPQL